MNNNTSLNNKINSSYRFFAILLLLLLVSCKSVEDIQFGDEENFKLIGIEDGRLKVELELPVDNPTMYPIKILSVDARTRLNGTYIGKMELADTIKIKAKSNELYIIPINIRLANIFQAAFIMSGMQSGSNVNLELEGTAKAKSLLMKKEADFKEKFLFKI